jgi:hypothetical protein
MFNKKLAQVQNYEFIHAIYFDPHLHKFISSVM